MSALTIPNSFSAGQTAYSGLVDANFAAISAWANGNVDNTNIGSAGLYASQLIPTTGPQAAFGGTQNYTFPKAVYSTPSGSTPLVISPTSFLNGTSLAATGRLVYDTFGPVSGTTQVLALGFTMNAGVSLCYQIGSGSGTTASVTSQVFGAGPYTSITLAGLTNTAVYAIILVVTS